jgi:hypothetical protein
MTLLLLRNVAYLRALLFVLVAVAQRTSPVWAIHHHSVTQKTTTSSNHHKKREKNRANHHNHEWPVLDRVVEQASSSTSKVSQKYPYESPHQQYVQRRRKLQDNDAEPDCGVEIGRVTVDEITQLMNLYLAVLVDSGSSSSSRTTTEAETDATLLESATSAFLSVIQYDLVAFKVCGSCAKIWDNHDALDVTEDLTMTGRHGFSTYCAPWSYGYEALHSALVLAPIDPETDTIFSDAVLRVAMAGRSTRVTVADAPSAFWPASVSEVLSSFSNTTTTTDEKAQLLTQFQSYIVPLMSATAGAVAIVPDFLGFGASQNYNRTFLTPRPYQQAFVVSYYATQDYFDKRSALAAAAMASSNSSTTSSSRTTETDEGAVVTEGDSTSVTVESNGVCTLVDRVATVSGYSEGGYAALVGALALEQMGVRILSTHIGGAPLNLELQLGFSLGTSWSCGVE